MSTTVTEIEEFASYAREIARRNHDAPSLEECLRRWREEQEIEQVVADVRQAEKEIAAGHYSTLEEADRRIRAELGWPPREQ